MGRSLAEILQSLPEQRRQAVLKRREQLVTEVLSLRQFQEKQRTMGQGMDIQLEDFSSLTLSTLRDYVESLGGFLDVVVTFPEQASIALDLGE
ncbi:MAG: hypothetical protein VKJ64_22265 [Leptolyngbyaceae bacterium]|nr:hypothetical protein [Leptolyngbyaceae bacterium]